MTEAEQDARWLAAWASRNGLPRPVHAELEAFAERVAIKMADMIEGAVCEHRDAQEAAARFQAAREWEQRLRESGSI